jgi:starch synthase (maltosyl-transferring)
MHDVQRLKPANVSPAKGMGARFLIEDIYPSIENGRFAVKRIVDETIDVWADVLRDGHDVLGVSLCWRFHSEHQWNRIAMRLHGNDRWTAQFAPQNVGRHFYAICAWTDRYATWRRDYVLKRDAGEDVAGEFLTARALMDEALADGEDDPAALRVLSRAISDFDSSGDDRFLLDEDVLGAMTAALARTDECWSETHPLIVDRPVARAGAWYEIFPRSQAPVDEPLRHGTFKDVVARIPQIAGLGYDVLYFPPIHPIGTTNRKGKNNALKAGREDPGSPYAIGSPAGGHDAIDSKLGTLSDFREVVTACHEHGMEVALDFAIQCSPDHPWIKEYPEWFKWQLDGTIRYAENPPKKYQDIVNPDLLCADSAALWAALRDVVWFWREQGVKIFRVDNPHTKAFPFWEWLIAEIQARDPEVIFLAEAFTRPKIMKALAKLGFTQSYTYFTWRETKAELTEYLTELSGYPEREYYRPNFFVNTPDILPPHLQSGEAWMFKSRVALASLLSSNYGVYSGFELLEHAPIPGKEEYLDSEKYELRPRDWNAPGNINDYIAVLNRIRRANPALLQTSDLRFLQVDSDPVIGFIKESVAHDNAVAAAIALAPGRHVFWLHFGDLTVGQADAPRPVRAIENLITGERHWLEWGGIRLTVDTARDPALIFRCVE